jgi:XTP/dITP diphosphohydrolase
VKRELVLATGNNDKLKEIRRLLKPLKVRVFPQTSFRNVPKIVENGKTFEYNAAKKARLISHLSDKITLADDSGLCVDALKGAPGVYSARFAGPGCTYEDNNRKLLQAMGDKPWGRRKASFHCAVALYLKGRRIKLVKGVCRGHVALQAEGKNGFGYDPVFVSLGKKKTFAQMSTRDKNRISHRAKALKATKSFLLRYWSSKRAV